jgi:hypothetical protein
MSPKIDIRRERWHVDLRSSAELPGICSERSGWTCLRSA